MSVLFDASTNSFYKKKEGVDVPSAVIDTGTTSAKEAKAWLVKRNGQGNILFDTTKNKFAGHRVGDNALPKGVVDTGVATSAEAKAWLTNYQTDVLREAGMTVKQAKGLIKAFGAKL